MAISAADRRTAIEGWLLSAICVIHGVRPTLLGWAVVLNLFALATAATIELSLRPGNPASRAWQSLALLPLTVLALLVFRPRIEAGERFACALALLIGFAGMWPLFAVWTR